jgi:hypothetical protein
LGEGRGGWGDNSKLGGEKAFPLAKVPGTARILSKTKNTRGQFFEKRDTRGRFGTSEKVPIKLNIKSKHKKPLKALN